MSQTTQADASVPGPTSAIAELLDLLRTIGVSLVLAVVFQTAVFQPYTIPSASMEPGLLVGDYLVVSKSAYGWSRASLPFHPPLPPGRLFGRLPERGDVVVFRHPTRPQETWIKRVIGLPGDRVELVDGVIRVNDRPLARRPLGPGLDVDQPTRAVMRVEERQADGRRYVTFEGGPDLAGDDRPPVTVPAGRLFVMGDHRDNSLDSRWGPEVGVGMLPVDHLIGEAELVVASWQPGAALWKPWTWPRLRPGRFLQPID
ncbi:signal peptidase I [Brevundimonas bacteroides]|uniref:signal peptidase I n=1 Tax=Brevundimonas bacteroides TaxID=74311 RepID=UPI0004952856|nr:signal peptidase I [Brevundimonas bacteroides]